MLLSKELWPEDLNFVVGKFKFKKNKKRNIFVRFSIFNQWIGNRKEYEKFVKIHR